MGAVSDKSVGKFVYDGNGCGCRLAFESIHDCALMVSPILTLVSFVRENGLCLTRTFILIETAD